MTDNPVMLIVIIVAVVAAIALIVWGILRWRYVKSLREKGWEFITSPSITIAHGLNCPPFGVGLGRAVDDAVRGQVDGVDFTVFEYKYRGFKENRVTVVEIPWALDEFQYSEQGKLEGVRGFGPVEMGPGKAHATSEEWMQTVQSVIGPVLPQVAGSGDTQFAIDGNHVVLLNTPPKPDEMEAHIRRAVALARALSAPSLEQYARPMPKQQLGFHGTDWLYEVQNDSALEYVQHTRGGFDHKAVDVISGPNDGLAFIALHHKWKTREQYTDSEGRTKTRIKNHDEYLMEVNVPFPFSPISFNAGWFSGGEKRQFESITFDKMFAVRSAHPKFAHDVVHPRTMQWMEQRGRVDLSIEDGRVRWETHSLNTANLAWRLDWTHGFFGRIPDFVWKDLGVNPPPRFRHVD